MRFRRDLAELEAVPQPHPASAQQGSRPARRLTIGVAGALVSAALVAGALAVTSSQRDSTPSTTPNQRGSAALVAPGATASQVDAALRMLLRRLRAAGFPDAVVTVVDGGTVRIITNEPILASVLERLARPGRLEFRPVTDGPIPAAAVVTAPPSPSTIEPPVIAGEPICDQLVDRATWFFDEQAENCYQLGPVVLGEPNIVSATAINDGEWAVEVEFGDDRFMTRVAEPLVGQRVAIVLDHVVMSAPTVNEGITGREVQIVGSPFTEDEARALAAVLASGSVLPIEFEVVEGAVPATTSTTNPFGIDVSLPTNDIGANGEPPRANVDHWHTALGINVCGRWLADPPEFHVRGANPDLRAGIHSHGDGLIHIHPFSTDEAGERATLRRFLEDGGWMAQGSDGLDPWARTDQCGAAASTTVTIFADGAVSDDRFDTRLGDQEVIVIWIGTGDEYPGDPPSTANLADPDGTNAPTTVP